MAGLPAGERLRHDLIQPSISEVVGGQQFQQMPAARPLADATNNLLLAQPSAADVSVDVFPTDVGINVRDFQGAFLETCLLSVTVLAASGLPFRERVDSIVRIAASATPTGQLLRGMFGDPARQPPPMVPPFGGLPHLPGIDPSLLLKVEELRQKGCINAVKTAMSGFGAAVSAAAPAYLPAVILVLAPRDACSGEELTITGRGMSDGTRSAVAFTRSDGGVTLVQSQQAREWTDARVRVVVPSEAVRGPVGILKFPVSSTPIGTAAGQAMAEVGTCFGPAVVTRVQQTIGGFVAPPAPAPTVQLDGANLFLGGPPVVGYFRVDPTGRLWPGKRITLLWSVLGADRIEIIARNVTGSALQELPAVNLTLAPTVGSTSVEVPGTHAWRGQYVLRCFNRCTGATPVERTVDLEMFLRRGLALGGGGTRGDFQVGALLYLYDVKGYRPDAIAATSVGSINAMHLVMGDDPPSPGAPARSAAARLAEVWRGLVDESSMWGEETWLTQAKAEVRRFIRSLSVEGLLLLPYAVVTGWLGAEDVFKEARKNGVVALFNLEPIKTLAKAQYSQVRTVASGIKLRLVSVSLETGETMTVDETGAIRQLGELPQRPPAISPAPPVDVVEGALASASMPGIFSARRLGDNMCVDGGVRDVVPVQVAVEDLGCNEVYAIRVSARPEPQLTDPGRSFGEVMARSVLGLTYDEIADDDVSPAGGWDDKVRVTVIRPSFDLHDAMVVEPGLIRIAMDYGWMRAADVIDVPELDRGYARELSDRITRLRVSNWIAANFAAGTRYRDPHRGFLDFLLAGVANQPYELQLTPTPEAVDDVRANCTAIRAALEQRLLIGAPTPVSAERTRWFTQWETVGSPPSSNDPWSEFHSVAGDRPAAQPPAPI